MIFIRYFIPFGVDAAAFRVPRFTVCGADPCYSSKLFAQEMAMHVRQFFRSILVLVLSVQLVALGLPAAEAGMIGTDQYAAAEQRDDRLARVQDFLAEERVVAQFEALGVDPDQASERVAALTDAELAQLDSQLDELPAGAGLLTILGVMFVVILVLELVGITNIFVAI